MTVATLSPSANHRMYHIPDLKPIHVHQAGSDIIHLMGPKVLTLLYLSNWWNSLMSSEKAGIYYAKVFRSMTKLR